MIRNVIASRSIQFILTFITLSSFLVDKRDQLICEDQESQSLNCSDLSAVIDIVGAELKPKTTNIDFCPTSPASNKTFGKRSSCKFNTSVFNQVTSKCEGRIWCNLSVESVQDDRCPNESNYLIISYKCVKRSNRINTG